MENIALIIINLCNLYYALSSMKIKIAAVQFKIKPFHPEINLKRMEKFIKEAKKKEVDIVVFPEVAVTPSGGKQKFIDFERRYKKHFQKLAQKYSINLCPGSFIEGEKDGWYNTTYFIDDKGKIKGKYSKIHLAPTGEKKYLKPGNRISAFETKYGKFGIIICWDLVFPEIFRELTRRKVKIIFCPSYWSFEKTHSSATYESEIERVNSLCRVRAFENEIFLIYVNAVGKTARGKKLIGQTQIAYPFPEKIKRFNDKKEGILFTEIDFKELSKTEKIYKIKKDFKRCLS